jgi:hypothetical protein
MESELILVYNADSGVTSLLKDAIHRTFFPSTYQCNLCALTYGRFSVKNEWRSFIEQLQMPYEFLHRDEFYQKLEAHPDHLGDMEFPAIFLNREDKIQILVNHEEINNCKTLDQLMRLITQKLKGA